MYEYESISVGKHTLRLESAFGVKLRKRDLTNKLAQVHKENTAPNQVQRIQKANVRSILNINLPKRASNRNQDATAAAVIANAISNGRAKHLSVSDVSDMLFEFYRVNAEGKASKNNEAQQQQQQQQQQSVVVGATAVTPAVTPAVVNYVGQTSSTSAETIEPSSIAAAATTAAIKGVISETNSKNLTSDEMMSRNLTPSFHPCIKYTDKNKKVPSANNSIDCNTPIMTAIPTSVVVPALSLTAEPLDIKPIINPTTGLVITPTPSVIKPVPVPVPVPVPTPPANPQAAAIAAALIRDGYHSFQQQIRAQELIKFHTGKFNKNLKVEESSSSSSSRILETFLRQQRNNSECEGNDTTISDNNEGDDEDDSRCNGFDDIHLVEGSKAPFPQLLQNVIVQNSSQDAQNFSDESQKFINLAAQVQAQAQVQALRNLEFSLGELSNSASASDSTSMGPTGIGQDGEPVYECRHCAKKYRWKSTLRRHENVECGGKEPSHQCPYCPYKSKQRGNLGVHVRKHHSNLPQLASRRRSKYSMKLESTTSSGNGSDDSNSKLIIDCSK